LKQYIGYLVTKDDNVSILIEMFQSSVKTTD